MIIKTALKEWDAVIKALGSGRVSVIARKGGILDEKSDFKIKSDFFALFPAFEHQSISRLRDEFTKFFNDSGDCIINYIASAKHEYTVTDKNGLKKFLRLQALTLDELERRFNRYSNKYLKFILLRVYRVKAHIINPYDYEGCISWVELKEPILFDNMTPVIDDKEFSKIESEFLKCLN